jgi:hypothetical protein
MTRRTFITLLGGAAPMINTVVVSPSGKEKDHASPF